MISNECTIEEQRRLKLDALWIGYEGQLELAKDASGERFAYYFERWLVGLADHINPNFYLDLKRHLNRFNVLEFNILLSRALQSNIDLHNLHRLGNMLGGACRAARDRPNATIPERRKVDYRTLRECVQFIAQVLTECSDCLAEIVSAEANGCSNEHLEDLIAQAIPAECREHMSRTELPFHALFKLATVAITSSDDEFEENADGQSDESSGVANHVSDSQIAEFPYGPLTGKLIDIAGAMGMKDVRTLKSHDGDTYRLVSVHIRRHEVYFRNKKKCEVVREQLERLNRHETA